MVLDKETIGFQLSFEILGGNRREKAGGSSLGGGGELGSGEEEG